MNSKERLINLINDRKVVKTEAVTTAGGTQTTTYLDIPGVLQDGEAMSVAGEVLLAHLEEHNLLDLTTMIVGPMTGSIPVVMGLTMTLQRFLVIGHTLKWSIIRDQVKEHGLGRKFVGAEPKSGDKVIIVDDVASSGRSLMVAQSRIFDTGAEVIAVVPLVDRGNKAARWFGPTYGLNIPYLPVLTYRDLGMEAL